MRLLLDTHIIVWSAHDDKKLQPGLARRIDNANEVFISSISVYEIEMKRGTGQLSMPEGYLDAAKHNGYTLLPFGSDHARSASGLPYHHRDPFDRMLIGQAKAEHLTFVTHDETIWQYSKEVAILRA